MFNINRITLIGLAGAALLSGYTYYIYHLGSTHTQRQWNQSLLEQSQKDNLRIQQADAIAGAALESYHQVQLRNQHISAQLGALIKQNKELINKTNYISASFTDAIQASSVGESSIDGINWGESYQRYTPEQHLRYFTGLIDDDKECTAQLNALIDVVTKVGEIK
jgi:succinylglutamate desuccinylase